MRFDVLFTGAARAEMAGLRVFDARKIVDAIARHLVQFPNVETRNVKKLEGVTASFPFSPPLWELRVGEHRVFYDVAIEDHQVRVLAVRRKGPTQRTEDVTHA